MTRGQKAGIAATVAAIAIGVACAVALDGRTNPAAAWLCPKDYDYTSGFNRICVYRCATGDVAITISVTEICPISIQR